MLSRFHFKQVVNNNKNYSHKLWKIINNIVSTKTNSRSKINGVFDERGKLWIIRKKLII